MLNKIKEKYPFLNFNDFQYELLIKLYKHSYRNLEHGIDIFIKCIFSQENIEEYNKWTKYLKISKSREELMQDITCNYVNMNLKLNRNIEDNIKELKKIQLFFDKYEFQPNIDFLTILIKNCRVIDEIVKSIEDIYSNIEDIIFDFDKCEIIYSLLDAYYLVHNIKIEYDPNYKNLINGDDDFRYYYNSIKDLPTLSKEREKRLASAIAQNDESAKKYLVICNLRLVVSIALKYVNMGLPIMDLIQEGNIGLIDATTKFDATKNYKFSTYATYRIRNKIIRAIQDQTTLITRPNYVAVQLRKVYLAKEKMILKNEKITIQELSKRTNIPEDNLMSILSINFNPESLDAYLVDSDEYNLLYLIDSKENPEEQVIENNRKESVMNFINQVDLTDLEKEVIFNRYGFYGEVFSVEETAKRLKISRNEVKINENVALKKMRFSPDVAYLADYIDYKVKKR